MQEFIYQIVEPSNNHVNPKAFSLVALSHAIRSIYSMELSNLSPSLCQTTLTAIELCYERFEAPSVRRELSDMVALLTAKVVAVNEAMEQDASAMFLYASVPDVVRQKPSVMSYILAFMYEVLNSLVDSITVVTDEHSEVDGQFSHLSVVEFDYDGIVWRYELPNLGVSHENGSANDKITRVVDGIKNPVFEGDAFDVDTLFGLISSAMTSKLACDYLNSFAVSDDKVVGRAKALAQVVNGDWHEYVPTVHDYPQIVSLIAKNSSNMSQYEIEVTALQHLTTLDANDIDKVLKGFSAV